MDWFISSIDNIVSILNWNTKMYIKRFGVGAKILSDEEFSSFSTLKHPIDIMINHSDYEEISFHSIKSMINEVNSSNFFAKNDIIICGMYKSNLLYDYKKDLNYIGEEYKYYLLYYKKRTIWL